MIRLLIAIRASDASLLSRALGSEFDIVLCTSLERARAVLSEASGFDAIGCGVHFDEGRIFDLLKLAKSDPRTRDIPFFCIKGETNDLSPAMLHSIETASRSMGAEGMFDIERWRAKYGDEAAFVRLREAIRARLGNAS